MSATRLLILYDEYLILNTQMRVCKPCLFYTEGLHPVLGSSKGF